MTVTTLASGSSGNCILVSHGGTHLLVDAGISCRRITQALAGLGLPPEELSGVLITHEHSDHIAGLATLFKRCHLPVWCSAGTGRELAYRIAFLDEALRPVRPGAAFQAGDLTVTAFPTSHDAAESVGYAFSDGVHKAAIATDLGLVTPAVEDAVRGAQLLVAEANHDVDLLLDGPYPPRLKRRILGPRGHLSNADCAALCAKAGAGTVILAHLSAENNRPELALEAVRAAVGAHTAVEVAPRSGPGRRVELV